MLHIRSYVCEDASSFICCIQPASGFKNPDIQTPTPDWDLLSFLRCIGNILAGFGILVLAGLEFPKTLKLAGSWRQKIAGRTCVPAVETDVALWKGDRE